MKICPTCKQQYPDTLNLCPEDKEVLEEDLQSLVGTTLDNQYYIEALLGQGGMGAVFRARHALLGDIVAIKVMPSSISQNSEYQRRFLREGKAARLFQHPNVVAVHDLRQTADGQLYMVLEYIEGRSLHSELKQRKRFSAQDAYDILAPIGEALDRAHQVGVIHRDLKPDNIMVGKDSAGQLVAKLLDLGIAKIQDVEATALTVDGQLLGTPYYMSPEQWNGSQIDHRADIYSLAVVFYELVSGKRPFEGRTLENLALQHLMNIPSPLVEVAPDTPPQFSNAIARALAKNPEERPTDCQQFFTELKMGLQGEAAPNPQNIAATLVATNGEESATRSGWWQSLKAAVPTMLNSPARQTQPQAQKTQKSINQVDNGGDKTGFRPETTSNPAVFDAVTVITTQSSLPVDSPLQPTIGNNSPTIPNTIANNQISKNSTQIGVNNQVEASTSQTKLLIIILGLLLGLIAGGYYLLRNKTAPASTVGINNVTAVASQEVLRYWLETYATGESSVVRQADGQKLTSSKLFRFGFQATQVGYVYIFGPDREGKTVGFLTAALPKQFTEEYGVASNKLTPQTEFRFPAPLAKQENGFSLDEQVSNNRFTLIWSPRPLTELATVAPGTPLDPAQLAQLQQVLKPLVKEQGERIIEPIAYTVINRPNKELNTPFWFEVMIGTH
jgi:eukaryotic-like serine/threonine-protein kinase